MQIMEQINTDMRNIMSTARPIFCQLWNEADCEYFFQLIFDTLVKQCRSGVELRDAVQMIGTNVNELLLYFDEKDGESYAF